MIYDLDETLKNRNQELFDKLMPKVREAEREFENNDDRKKPLRVGNMLTQNIYTALTRYHLMSNEEFAHIDNIDLETYYQYYMDFISEYSLFEIASTKQLFCAYMRITVSKFNYLMENTPNEALKEYANYINDNINGLIYASAETGNVDSKSALTRGKIKKDGQNLVEVKEEIALNISDIKSPEQILAEAKKSFLLASKSS